MDDTTLDNGSSTSPKAVAAHDHSDAETALAPHVLLSSAAAVRAYALHNQDWLRHVLATYDSLTPGILRAQELASMATLARTLTGPSALTGLREAMQAHLQAEQLVLSWGRQGALAPARYMDHLVSLSASIRDVMQLPWSDALEHATAAHMRLARLNTGSVSAWCRLTTNPPATESAAMRLTGAAATTFSLASVSALIVGAASPGDPTIEPWHAAPREMRSRLLARLADLDANLPNKLHAAWDRSMKPGPGAGSQIANSLMELIDWTLRLAAPEDAVLRWHTDGARPKTELTDQGTPTRASKVRYLLRARDSDGRAAEAYVKQLGALVDLLQGGKHRLTDEDMAVVRHMIPTVEGFLTFVLLAPQVDQ